MFHFEVFISCPWNWLASKIWLKVELEDIFGRCFAVGVKSVVVETQRDDMSNKT